MWDSTRRSGEVYRENCFDRFRYNPTMARWLVKEEPENYAYAQLERDGKTVWAGVRNPLAQKHLRSIRKGDSIFYYHTGKEKAVVGIAKAAGDAYPDPANSNLFVVDVVPQKALAKPVTLAAVKADKAFATFPLVRMSRLSVMPVTDEEWARIETMSRG
jgi:predicted RNA-binding protein with PUA-like domain